MIKEVTFDLFKKYAVSLKKYYKNNNEIKDALLNVGLDTKNMINLDECFHLINPCFGESFLNKSEDLNFLFFEINNKEINIDKDKFVKIMNILEDLINKMDESSAKIRKLCSNGDEWDVYFPTSESILFDLLTDIFNDKLENRINLLNICIINNDYI